MRQVLGEFVGTFFFLLTICLAVSGSIGPITPLVIGLSLMTMVYACGHLSGAHFNPAVSIAMVVRGKLNPGEAIVYSMVQLAAGALAAGVAIAMKGDGLNPSPIGSAGAAFGAELLGTFALVWVVLQVATSRGTQGNPFYGAAIGMVLAVCAFIFGPISKIGAFNPAVVLAGAIFGLIRWGDAWIPLLGSVIGGTGAAFAFRASNADDR